MDIFNLSAILRLDSSQYEQGLSDAENKASGMGGKLGGALGKAAQIGVAAWGAASAAVGAFAVDSVKTGAEFDKAMAQVGATMLKTTDEMEKEVGSVSTAYGDFSGNLREFAMFLGSETAFSATQAAEALNYMALAGYNTQESMEMLPNVMSLAAAGGMDLARASDMVTDTQTAFGISAERTSQMVDEMAKAASTGNTSVEQLGDAFLVVGGLAQELNGGFITLADGTKAPVDGIQEMEIAMTAMANAGIKGSEAGTHMRNMIMKLSNPTKEGAEWMEQLGLNVYDAEGQMRSLNDIFGDLGSSMENLTQEQKIQAISALFNARDLTSAEAILGAIEQDWDEIGASILDSENAAAEMANIQLDNLAGDITLFQSALEGAKILISDQLTPSLREFVQFGTESISTLSEAFKEGGLSGAMEALSGIIADGLSRVIAAIPEFLSAGAQLLMAIAQGIIANVPVIFEAGLTLIQNLGNGIIQNGPTAIAAMGNNLSQLVATVMQKLPEFLSKGVELIGQMAHGILQNAPAILTAIGQALVQVIATIASNLPQFLAKGLEIIAQIASGIIQAIPQAVAAIPQVISGITNAFTSFNWLSIGGNIISGIASGIRNAAGSVISAVTSVASSAFDGALKFLGIRSPSRLFRDKVGKMIPAGMALGVEETAPQVVQAVEDMNDDAYDAIDDVGYDSGVVVKREERGKDADPNSAVISAIQQLADAIYYLDEGLYNKMVDALESMRFDINEREFGRLVRDVRTA